MKSRLVSVIICARNSEETIGACLDSLTRQTYSPYEIIVVDNASTDATASIVAGYKTRFERLLCIREEKVARGAARNAGIRAARGTVIAMTDSDCIVPRNWLMKITRPILEENEAVVMGSQKEVIRNSWSVYEDTTNSNFWKYLIKGKYILILDTKNCAIDSDLIKAETFDAGLGTLEDYELFLRLKGRIKIRFAPEVAVKHNHPFSPLSLWAHSFERGFWTRCIYEKHKGRKELEGELMMESMSARSFLSFPRNILSEFFRVGFSRGIFTLLREAAWRMGIIYRAMSRRKYQ